MTTVTQTATKTPDDVAEIEPENLPDPAPTPSDEIGLAEIGINSVDDGVETRHSPIEQWDPGYEDERPIEAGHDGDDIGQLTPVKFRLDGNGDPERMFALMAPGDLVQSGHGFMVRDLGEGPKTTWRNTCELCGSAIHPPADEWVCEVGHLPGTEGWSSCACNWCLIRGMWLRGEFRPKGGRPAKRCGTSDCTRRAAAERQRKSRAKRKAQSVTETPLSV